MLVLALVFAVAAIVAGLRYGGAPERGAALVLIMMLLVPRAVHWLGGKSFDTVDPAAFATDLLALIGFLFIALTANRYWPLWVTSLQLLSVTAHLIRWFDVKVEPLVYAAMSGAPSYAISLSVLLGTANYYRRRKLVGVVPPWRNSLPRSTRKTPA